MDNQSGGDDLFCSCIQTLLHNERACKSSSHPCEGRTVTGRAQFWSTGQRGGKICPLRSLRALRLVSKPGSTSFADSAVIVVKFVFQGDVADADEMI